MTVSVTKVINNDSACVEQSVTVSIWLKVLVDDRVVGIVNDNLSIGRCGWVVVSYQTILERISVHDSVWSTT